MTQLAVPTPCVHPLYGPLAAGKSTWARQSVILQGPVPPTQATSPLEVPRHV